MPNGLVKDLVSPLRAVETNENFSGASPRGFLFFFSLPFSPNHQDPPIPIQVRGRVGAVVDRPDGGN
jgi:hypothetical protein